MTTNYKFNKKQIAEILKVHPKTISKWDDKKILKELEKNCYKVLEIKKEGRSIYYYCEYQEYSMSNDEYLKEIFNVDNVRNFKNYSKTKIKNIEENIIMTRKDLCKKTNTKITTSENWDRKLIEKGVIQKDGFIYICVNLRTKERCIVDRQAYTHFWHINGAIKKSINILYKEYLNNNISMTEYEYSRDSLLINNNVNNMYYKVSKNVVKYDNYLTSLITE